MDLRYVFLWTSHVPVRVRVHVPVFVLVRVPASVDVCASACVCVPRASFVVSLSGEKRMLLSWRPRQDLSVGDAL